MTKVRVLNVDSSTPEVVISETFLDITPSCTIGTLKSEIPSLAVSSIYSSGKQINDTTLTTSVKNRTFTATTKKNKNDFQVVESESLQLLQERGEGYRLLKVFKSLNEINNKEIIIKNAQDGSGSGGVFFFKSSTSVQGCFKPRENEPGSKNNPNNNREGILPGEQAEREVAAFILDWGGFSGVPGTLLVESLTKFNSKKVGSFQYFVPNAVDTVGDFSPHLFDPNQVHKIGILDIRFLNLDRNDSNILVIQKNSSSFDLIPIDHGLCFPDKIELAWCDWVWWDWPQTLIPFDKETKEFVNNLNIEEDLKILKNCFGLRIPCLRIYKCMTMLLKKGVSADLNLRDIASVVVRSKNINEPSAMEKTFTRASELASLMESNSRKEKDNAEGRITRASSFDGNTNNNNKFNDELFFSYINRLLDDVVCEILEKKSNSPVYQQQNGWFSVSTRSSPCELTKMASPRLSSVRLNNFNLNNDELPSLNLLNQ